MHASPEKLDERLSPIIQARLLLATLEKEMFGTALQIRFEIMLFLAANSGRVLLTEVYRKIEATDAAIRLHIRALEAQKLVSSHINGSDARSKYLTLTASGISLLNRYCADFETKIFSPRSM